MSASAAGLAAHSARSVGSLERKPRSSAVQRASTPKSATAATGGMSTGSGQAACGPATNAPA